VVAKRSSFLEPDARRLRRSPLRCSCYAGGVPSPETIGADPLSRYLGCRRREAGGEGGGRADSRRGPSLSTWFTAEPGCALNPLAEHGVATIKVVDTQEVGWEEGITSVAERVRDP
jgi:hypothetical protein